MKSIPLDELACLATGRPTGLFAKDVEERRYELADSIAGCRILVIGGAGSIGSATIREIIRFGPSAIHVVDQNENGLTELVRDLRSQPTGLAIDEFRTFPIDFGSPIMARLIATATPYDCVLNFAALKHVRSEKDILSLLQMFDTNIVKAAGLLRCFTACGFRGRYFAVSTDKAANPVNLMGASKRLMEHVTLSGDFAGVQFEALISARFANVAFSDGSLLHGFLQRLQKEQPLAVPGVARRFFVSTREAGQLCMIAAFCAADRAILIPRLDPVDDLHDLREIAEKVLVAHGFTPRLYESEREARTCVVTDRESGHYPLLLTPLDTSGEKVSEEFVGKNEMACEIGLSHLLSVQYEPLSPGAVGRFVQRLERVIRDTSTPVEKAMLVEEVTAILPEFRHVETGRTLDGRM